MIHSVRKLKNGQYMLNDAVIISDIIASDEGIDLNIDYDPDMITQDEANHLASTFINDALTAAIKKEE